MQASFTRAMDLHYSDVEANADTNHCRSLSLLKISLELRRIVRSFVSEHLNHET